MVVKIVENSLANNTTNLIDGTNPIRIKHYENATSKAVEAMAEAAGVAPEVQETDTPERVERRAAFKRAAEAEARAQRMEKEAKEKLAKAENFEKLKATAQQDPVALAKALDLDPTEFLRLYQNQMLSIPNETPVKPEEEVKARLERYEAERQREKTEFQQLQAQTIRANYTATKILPVLAANPEKFEMLNDNGAEASAAFIYDMMDKHFRETGEELNPLEVAEEFENLLAKEVEEKLERVKKSKKFSKHFAQIEAEEAPPNTANGRQLGASPRKTFTERALPEAPVQTKIPFSNREARLKRALSKFKDE